MLSNFHHLRKYVLIWLGKLTFIVDEESAYVKNVKVSDSKRKIRGRVQHC